MQEITITIEDDISVISPQGDIEIRLPDDSDVVIDVTIDTITVEL
jgi:hypothetical protein